MICLGCSAGFHLYKDKCETLHTVLARVDYAGISILIAGSNIPPIYYSFYCPQVKSNI
jgi:adiponectin receptor